MSYANIRNANYKKENNLQGRIIKTTNVACELIITSDKNFLKILKKKKQKDIFKLHMIL